MGDGENGRVVEWEKWNIKPCYSVKNSALLSGKKILYWNELSILPYNDPGESF